MWSLLSDPHLKLCLLQSVGFCFQSQIETKQETAVFPQQFCSFFFFFFFWFFETGFLCVALAVLELTFLMVFVDQAVLELRNPPASAPKCWD